MRQAFDTSVKSIIKSNYLAARGFVLKTIILFLVKKKSPLLIRNLRNILFIRVDRVGDMALSTPSFKAIKAALPHVKLTVMASPVNAPILKNNPNVDDVFVYDRSTHLTEKVRLINALRSHHFDLAIDPYTDYELETAWLAGMSGAVHRIGYAAFGREIFFNGPTLEITRQTHFVDLTLDLLKGIGISVENRQPAIYLDGDEQCWANQWLNENELQDKKLIAIHPGAHYETQRWLPEYYADLIRLIREQTQAEVIVFGGPSDAAVIENILIKISNPVYLYIQDDIRKFLALLSQCHMLVCNNSGPLHCAVGLSIPTISFMGPTVQEQWMPVGAIHRVLRLDDLACIGCNRGWCKIKTHDCMKLIRPDNVLEIILQKVIS